MIQTKHSGRQKDLITTSMILMGKLLKQQLLKQLGKQHWFLNWLISSMVPRFLPFISDIETLPAQTMFKFL